MNYLGRLFSSAQQYYKSINVANLTGAVDVIVVKNKNGEYQSTPFYVRFGKMGVLYPQGQLVDITINGQPRPDLCMHVGPTGYAHFDNKECKLKAEKTESPMTSNEELQTWENHENDPIDSGTSELGGEQLENIFDLDLHEVSIVDSPKHDTDESSNYQLVDDVTQLQTSAPKMSLVKPQCETSEVIETEKENTSPVSLKDLVDYLQNTDNWPNEFYIYHFLNKPNTSSIDNKSIDNNNSDNKSSQVNSTSSQTMNTTTTTTKSKLNRSKFFRRKSTITCELLYPEDFLKLDTVKVSFNSVWIIWSGCCMSSETAALILLRNLSQVERKVLIERDTLRAEYNLVLQQHKLDRRSESPLNSSINELVQTFGEPESQTNQPSNTSNNNNNKDKSSWLWWRSRKTTTTTIATATTTSVSDAISDLDSQDLTYQEPTTTTASPHREAVQSILAPIDLRVSSPVFIQEEFDQENYERENYPISPPALSKNELLNIPGNTIPLYSSTIDVRYRSKTPDPPQSACSPDEAGYFSDEGEHNSVFQNRSENIERGISDHQKNHLTSEQLKNLNLVEGANEAVFSVVSKYQGTCQCACYIYLWNSSDKIVISDIDGTITKSDWLGQLMPLVGMDWTHPHIAHLYNKIALNGYKFIYLSSRPIGQARATRKLLYAIQQGNYRLPDGPILLSPFSVLEAFRKEVILKRADEYKIECLREVCSLFPSGNNTVGNEEAHEEEEEEDSIPFIAGFGNRPTDIATYKAVGLQDHQIFTVDYLGNVLCGDPGKASKPDNNNQTSPKQQTSNLKSNENVECSNNTVGTTVSPKVVKTLSSPEKLTPTVTTTATANTCVYANSVLAKLNLDSLLQMADVYFPQVKDRLIYATKYSDYTYWRM
ncbi:unnamed protein product [Trichobilharzia szidati]|nr:unnamed protein product [Trichobilharzia szidati]